MTGRSICEPRESLTPAAQTQRSPRVAAPLHTATARLAARLAGVLTVAVLAVGLAVQLAFAGWARHLLAFHFPRIAARPEVAVTVFVHNLHALLAIGGALLVAQAPYLTSRAAEPARVHRGLQRGCEVLVAGGVAANVIVIGASFGAYGIRMARAALPHGPVELAAYSLALALYVQARHRPLPARHLLTVAALSTCALAAAALLETYMNL
jgi:hypothetical protein